MELSKSVEPKEAELLLLLARAYKAATGKGIPAKRLVKLLYLIDLIARQYLGRAVSSFRYVWWDYGPYDTAIKAVAKQLVVADVAERTPEWDNDNLTVRLIAKRDEPLFTFAPTEDEIIRYVVQNYLTMGMEELINEVVYLTEPWKTKVGRKGDLLPMGVVDNAGRDAVGFDLEEVLRAEKEIEAGRGAATL
ncbi:MAG: Panacea domain-containing protein [Gemmatimonadales bacterium]